MTQSEQKAPVFRIATLGCKVNQCESYALAHHLEAGGGIATQGKGDGDDEVTVCIINTCTVTHKAAMQSRQAIRQAIRRHPQAQIIVTGCYAQTEPDAIAGIEGVDAVLGHSHKFDLPGLLASQITEAVPSPERRWSPVRQATEFAHLPVSAFGNRTRPFLRIQDGCDAFCTYCIVPHARGPSRSMPTATVAEQLTALGAKGFREVVLTGIHMGAFGQDLSPATTFTDLLKEISAAGAVDQLRLSSIEPTELNAEIVAIVAASQAQPRGRICPHFHIPLQSGDDEILTRMHRPYTGAAFDEEVATIAHHLPRAAIGADTLIGFPGESEAAFENTYKRIEKLPITYLHVFPFSPRKGTPAFHFKQRVPDDVVKARCQRMRALGERKKRTFFQGLVGSRVQVLVEGGTRNRDGGVKGMTDNYVPVHIQCQDKHPVVNTFVEAQITAVTKDLRVLGALIT